MKLLWLFTAMIIWSMVNGPGDGVVQKKKTADAGFAVVELFTSEGCSSCPPAEKLLKEIHQQYQGRAVYVLAFHVDYWDKLGWKDKFSDSKYSGRQYKYSVFFQGRLYTPQAIINGKEAFVGSEGDKIKGAIDKLLRKKVTLPDTEYKVRIKDGQVTLDYLLGQSLKGNLLSVALLQNQESVQVMAGENKGKLLEHVNVVRSFYSEAILDRSGSLNLDLPKDTDAKGLHVLVYLQDQKNLNVISATEISL
ncbi:DUF1223 domain-containing protein [Pedobacter steynii]|uniref:DUF1223 domain-containing protein n=1 Tax=Pedobacter steynii TaxID=430522 RepID=A0A1D7QHN6_9SPHI|nr:DUF1223 domain-containing protein [Pedobacter steynii]AOM78172.1 hypothetical protein BFS30_13945 [Pedobacter steynii]